MVTVCVVYSIHCDLCHVVYVGLHTRVLKDIIYNPPSLPYIRESIKHRNRDLFSVSGLDLERRFWRELLI